MSTSTQPTTFLDIYTDIANRVRADTNITDTLNQAKRYANIGLHDMHIGSSERFPWAERDAILVTHPLFQFDGSPDGGVYIQQGKSSGVFTRNATADDQIPKVATITGIGSFTDPEATFAGATSVYVTSPGHGLGSGVVVLVSGVVGVTGLNGVQASTNVDSEDTFTVYALVNVTGKYERGGIAIATELATGATSLGITDTNSVGQVNMRPGGKLVVSGDSEPYEITSVASHTIHTEAGFAGLDSVYTNSTTAIETGFTYFEDEYDLASDFLRPVDVQRFASGAIPIQLIGRTKFRNRYPKVITTGLPTIATIMDREVGTITATTGAPADTLPRRRIRFWPAPGDIYRIPYSYVTGNLATSSTGVAQTQMSADTDEPIVPLRYRMAIIYHALYSWYRDRKDDVARAKEAKAQYEELVGRVRSDVEVGQSRPQIRPALRSYRRSAKRPWGGGGSRRFDMGNFDYLGD